MPLNQDQTPTTQLHHTMGFESELQPYPLPSGLHIIPEHLLDTRPDDEIDHTLLHPSPIISEKNIFFFWHRGFTQMHPYAQRNIRAWHRRFSPSGWTIRVLDRLPDSPLNVANYLDITDPGTFPRAFCDGTIGGDYAPQHTSDLVRWPLLLKYGGIYADVGMMQIGDLERLWNATIGDPSSIAWQTIFSVPAPTIPYFCAAINCYSSYGPRMVEGRTPRACIPARCSRAYR